MKLHYRSQGQGPSLIILHGLLGMLDNWASLAKEFSDHYSVYSIDLRNHGKSPHTDEMSYDLMAADVVGFMDDMDIDKAVILGHSMGGKVAMQVALTYPDRVEALVSVDIAPRRYEPGHDHILEALASVDPLSAESRSDVEDQLMSKLGNLGVVRFLMKNLSRRSEGGYQWKMNLDAITRGYDNIIGAVDGQPFGGPVLFLAGGRSPYISESDWQAIHDLFPGAGIQTIDGAGHWVHAEKPEELLHAVRTFLESVS